MTDQEKEITFVMTIEEAKILHSIIKKHCEECNVPRLFRVSRALGQALAQQKYGERID